MREQSQLDNSRPGDIFHPNFRQGKAAYIDVTVKNTLRKDLIVQNAEAAGAAAARGEEDKDRKYRDNVERLGVLFVPLPVESFGVWTNAALSALGTISSLSAAGEDSVSAKASNLKTQLSVLLWTGNADCVLHVVDLLGEEI